MAGYRKRARKHCGRKRSRGQKRAGKRVARAPTRAERRRKRYADDPQFREATLAYNRAYYAANKTEMLARWRTRYAEDTDYRRRIDATNRRSTLKRVYGITP